MLRTQLADFGVHVSCKSQIVGFVVILLGFQISNLDITGTNAIKNRLIARRQSFGRIMPTRSSQVAGINLFNCFVILALSKRLRISLRSCLNRVSFGFALIPLIKAKSTSNDHNRRGHTANNGEGRFLHDSFPIS